MNQRLSICVSLFTILLLQACNKKESITPNFKGKVFYGVVTASCNPTKIVNLGNSSDYVLMIFEDASGNGISYQPKPNTWYKMSGNAGIWAKTGSDVTPKDIPLGFDFLSTEHNSPCK